jgi:oligoribonuclease
MSEDWQNISKLIWIDLEMTGLDTDKDHIIEVATIVTDQDLNVIEEGPELILHQPESVLNQMDEWNTRQHQKTGLTQKVLESQLTLKEAEDKTLEFLSKHLKPKHSPMCGNSICQDRRFLARLMPNLEAFFHYRHLDVSTIKELARRWSPELYSQHEKKSKHRAMEDIYESIDELRFYQENFFRIIK